MPHPVMEPVTLRIGALVLVERTSRSRWAPRALAISSNTR